MRTLFISVSLSFLFAIQADGQMIRQVKNQAIFTKLYGYVRYFHPSDEAADIDWEKMAIYGSRQVAACNSDSELKTVLTDLFSPIVPVLQVYQNDRKTTFDKVPLIPDDTTGYKVISWQHLGVGLSKDRRSLFKSFRTNRPAQYAVERSPFGAVNKFIDATPYRGKQFEFRARLKIADGDGSGHLWVRVDKKNKQLGFFNNMMDRPVVTKEWHEYKINGVIDKDAERINTGVFLLGTGTLYCDDVALYIRGENKGKPVYELSFNTDTTAKFPSDLLSGISERNMPNPFYSFLVSKDAMSENNKFLSIKSIGNEVSSEAHQQLFNKYPKVGEFLDEPLGDGLGVMIPLALYGTKTQTYPSTNKDRLQKLKAELKEVQSAAINGQNLYTRLADVAITWNVFQHFYPYFEVAKTDWTKDLELAVESCYRDKTSDDFAATLKKLTAKLKDGHIFISSPADRGGAFLPPVTWEWIEDKLVITNVLSNDVKLKRGDLVLAINGRDPKEYFKETEQYISAATQGWLRYRSETESLKGSRNSLLKLNTEDSSGGRHHIQLNRTMSYADHQTAISNRDVIKQLYPGVMYVNIGKARMKEIDSVLFQLKQCKAIICDLRGYPADNTGFIEYLMTGPDTSSQWMQIPEVIYPNQKHIAGYQKEGWSLSPRQPHLDAKVFFLIDGRAISYAESYLSFIEHYKLATLVGKPTAGTNGNVNELALPGNYSVRWTGMKVLKHDGTQHHGTGIIPDVTVEKTIKGVREGRDEFLEKALQLIQEKK